jgi:steroid delta-isomerase-like uncharacterized protein
MSAQNKDIVRRYFETVNTKDLGVLDEVVHPDVTFHGMEIDNLEQLKVKGREIQAAFPDVVLTVDHLVAEADRVAALVTARGTHTGEFEGIPATGRPVENVVETDIFRLQDGKIVEVWHLYDVFGFMTQLGLLPEMEAAQ